MDEESQSLLSAFPAYFWVIFFGFALIAGCFSRFRPMAESYVLILVAHYIVINQLLWDAFLWTSYLQGGETVFRFGLNPLPSAMSFYLGLVMIVALLWVLVHLWRKRAGDYSLRQKILFTAAALLFLGAALLETLTPVKVQAEVDKIPMAVSPDHGN